MSFGNISAQTSQERYDYLLNRMVEEFQDYAIILLDRDGNVILWNKGAEHIKGYSEKDVTGKHFRLFYSAEDQQNKVPEAMLEKAAKEGKAVYEGWRLRKDKTKFWGSMVLTALHDEKGEVIAFSKVTRDLTERKASEDFMRKKNEELEAKNQELASFAYVASHDLQEPLRKIQTFLSRIGEMEASNLSERSADFFKRILSASERMQKLIDDLLAYSRTSTDKRQAELVDLNTLVADVKREMTDFINEKHAVIEVNQLPNVTGVAFQLNQLFTNLFSNALKFSKADPAPRIVVSSSPAGQADVMALGLAPGRYNQVTVSDNGIGFEQQYNKKIFEIFQRLHGRSEYSGTGIGLAICKKIVENHHGTITADGIKDVGATFHIYFPVT
jgi:PAS domain S-box-containing protein